MSHSKDKDFNETGKWQEAFFLFLNLSVYCKANRQFPSQVAIMH